jgi:hypothetical protein
MLQIKNQIKFILAILVLFGVSATSVCAESDRKRFSATVNVSVSASDDIKGQVESYIKRELRSLQDVSLVDEGGEWQLSILAMEVSTKGGHKSGVILSVVILTPFNNQLISSMFEEEYRDFGTNFTEGLYLYPEHGVRVGSNEELRSLCFELVADFDSKHLEKSRKQHREFQKMLESSSPNK